MYITAEVYFGYVISYLKQTKIDCPRMDNVIEENLFQLQAVKYNQIFVADHLGNAACACE